MSNAKTACYEARNVVLESFYENDNNGLEARKKLAADDFDIVLMDVQMPEMDGLSATMAIRAIEHGEPFAGDIPNTILQPLRSRLQGQRIPIIAMTAHALEEDQQRCLKAGMNG